jgi:hypothetical protein
MGGFVAMKIDSIVGENMERDNGKATNLMRRYENE